MATIPLGYDQTIVGFQSSLIMNTFFFFFFSAKTNYEHLKQPL